MNVDELGNTKNVRETLLTVIEYLKTTLRKNTIKFLGSKFKIFYSFFIQRHLLSALLWKSHLCYQKELRGLSSNFHIHVSVSDLYIFKIGQHIIL